MIGSPFLRTYSTALPLGRVVTSGSLVSLHLPAANSQSDIFARLKQGHRADVFDKVERSLMWEQLSMTRRRLIFRPTRSQELAGRDEPLTVKFRTGKKTREVEMQPKQYAGPPSVQDLRVIVLTSRTAEDVQDAFNVLSECLRYKETRKNISEELIPQLLRQAAAAGCFQSIYSQITVERELFKNFTKQAFYQEALRIYALRTPFLAARAKDMIRRTYIRSSPGLSRDLVMVYALAAYGEKFGAEHAKDLPKYLKNIKTLETSPRLLKRISLEDITLGLEGLRKAGVSEKDENVQTLTSVLQKRGRNRPQRETLVVNVADRLEEWPVAEESSTSDQKAEDSAA